MTVRDRNGGRWPVAALAILGAAACGSGEVPPADVPIVRDSAGVRIVEHPAELASNALDLELIWEHGHSPGDYGFQFVFMGALLPDGSAVAGDGGNQEVAWVAPDGSGSRVLAGTGQGPDEVLGPRMMFTDASGRLWIEDVGNRKLLVLEDGEVAEVVAMGGEGGLVRTMPVAVAADGAVLLVTGAFDSDFETPWLDGHLTRYSPSTGAIDSVGTYPMASRRPDTGINPFGHAGFAVGAGRGWVQARTDRPEVIWRGAGGDVTQIVRWGPPQRFPDAAMWRAFEERLRADLARVNPGMTAQRLEIFLDERVAAYAFDESLPLPYLGRVVASPQGDVWIPTFDPMGARASEWTLLPADGLAASTASFPRPSTVLGADDEKVLVVYEDDLDVQALALYRYARTR